MTLVSALVTKGTPEKRLIFQKNHAKIPKKANSLNFSAFTTACTGSTPTRALGLPSVSGAQPPPRETAAARHRAKAGAAPPRAPSPSCSAVHPHMLELLAAPPLAPPERLLPTRCPQTTPAGGRRTRGESRRRPHSPSGSVSRKVQPSPPPRSSSRSPSIERMRSREIASPSPTPGLRPFSASPEREKG